MNGKQLLAALLAAAAVSAAGASVWAGSASGAGPGSGAREERTITSKEAKEAQEREELVQEVTIAPETLDSVSFAQVETLIRENNLNVRVLDEQIAILEELDYEDMEQKYRDSLNGMAMMQDLYRMQSNSLSGTVVPGYSQREDAEK